MLLLLLFRTADSTTDNINKNNNDIDLLSARNRAVSKEPSASSRTKMGKTDEPVKREHCNVIC